jgi:hypothetical protein
MQTKTEGIHSRDQEFSFLSPSVNSLPLGEGGIWDPPSSPPLMREDQGGGNNNLKAVIVFGFLELIFGLFLAVSAGSGLKKTIEGSKK